MSLLTNVQSIELKGKNVGRIQASGIKFWVALENKIKLPVSWNVKPCRCFR